MKKIALLALAAGLLATPALAANNGKGNQCQGNSCGQNAPANPAPAPLAAGLPLLLAAGAMAMKKLRRTEA